MINLHANGQRVYPGSLLKKSRLAVPGHTRSTASKNPAVLQQEAPPCNWAAAEGNYQCSDWPAAGPAQAG